MTVRFGSIEEFLDDLRAAATRSDEGETVDDGMVRVSIERDELSLTSWRRTFTAGFSSLGELRHLTLDCGVDYERQEPTGQKTADLLAKSVRDLCAELKLTVRGGRFEEA